MIELASKGQLRGSLLRWALVLVPTILLLGMLSMQLANRASKSAWFASLIKPSLYPPELVSTLVWIALYVLMGLALSLVAAARGAEWRLAALATFCVQLTLNLAWSPMFLAGHQILATLAVLIMLDFAVAATTVLFRLVRPVAALLLLPYLAAVLFVTLVVWQFHAANPDADNQEDSEAAARFEI